MSVQCASVSVSVSGQNAAAAVDILMEAPPNETMALRERQELVAKRFVSVVHSATGKKKADPDVARSQEYTWRAGVIRAATHRDNHHPDLQVNHQPTNQSNRIR